MFHPGAYWEEIEQVSLDMKNSIMNVEGVSFRAPTTTAKDRAAVFMDRPKKQNYEETFYQYSFYRTYKTAPREECKWQSKSR